jgi:hypothetical protein
MKPIIKMKLIIPIITMLISFTVCILSNITSVENIIITLLIGIISCTFSQNINLVNIEEFSIDINKNVRNIESLTYLKHTIENIEHPYFQKWAQTKLNFVLSQNRDFFAGTNYTFPQAADTFGIEGLKYTKQRGILKAVSVVNGYWDDVGFTQEYLKEQEDLIKNKNVTIQRIFVFPQDKKTEFDQLMKLQKEKGIDVRFIHKENPFVNAEFLNEDYLIQDDKLLVQIFCSTYFYNEKEKFSELITIDETKVKEMITHFSRLYERSERYDIKR